MQRASERAPDLPPDESEIEKVTSFLFVRLPERTRAQAYIYIYDRRRRYSGLFLYTDACSPIAARMCKKSHLANLIVSVFSYSIAHRRKGEKKWKIGIERVGENTRNYTQRIVNQYLNETRRCWPETAWLKFAMRSCVVCSVRREGVKDFFLDFFLSISRE